MAYPKRPSGNPMHAPVKVVNPKTKTAPKAAGKPKATPKKTMTIGFNPQKMAKTLTNLGYDADLADLQRQVDMARGNMNEALADLQGWAAQIGQQHQTDSAATAAAYDQAVKQAQSNDANIAALFGGAAGGEAGAYAGVGEDLIGALGASDKAFASHMNSILGAQAQDYQRRARAAFQQQIAELTGQRTDLLKEKGQAAQKNLLDLMDMAWGRKQDILQYQTAQEALRQSRAMAGLDLAKGQQDIVKGGQQIAAGQLDLKAQKLAIRKSQIELKKLVDNPNGVDWNDPATRSQIGNAAFSGSLSPRSTFAVSPKIALANAMTALEQMGLTNDPRAVAAVKASFAQILRLSHGHKQWTKWKLNKNGQLIFAPASKPSAVIKPGHQNTPKGGWPKSAFPGPR